ncbi:MAG: enoyl-CoA hydratase/isomerase family protein [Acidimicrobiia bacterium]
MEYEQIMREQRDDIVLLTLNRPERMNAWTPRMTGELTHAIEAADADPSVGAVVLTGAGRGFCAGADVSAVFDAQLQGDDSAALPEGGRDWIDLIRTTKPIVAAVNGAAIGLGLTMILPFDRIVVADGAKLSVRFVKMGLVPELASSLFLPLRCGWGAASDLMLSGRTLEAADAFALGIVDEVVAPDALLDVALERARSYGTNPSPQLRWIKQLLTQNVNETNPRAAQIRELKLLQEAYATPEHKDAVAAYLERR